MLRDQTTLVLGRVSDEVAALAERTAAERGARLVRAPEDPGPELRLLAPGRFQRRNFALARTAAEVFLGELDPERVAAVAATVSIPGRLELIAARPPTYIDAAHNPDGVAALAEALPAVVGERRVVACLAVLADKDAVAMARILAPVLDRAVCTELPSAALRARGRPGAHSHPAAALVAACEAAGLRAEAEPDFATALRRGTELAAGAARGRPADRRLPLRDRPGAGRSGRRRGAGPQPGKPADCARIPGWKRVPDRNCSR